MHFSRRIQIPNQASRATGELRSSIILSRPDDFTAPPASEAEHPLYQIALNCTSDNPPRQSFLTAVRMHTMQPAFHLKHLCSIDFMNYLTQLVFAHESHHVSICAAFTLLEHDSYRPAETITLRKLALDGFCEIKTRDHLTSCSSSGRL